MPAAQSSAGRHDPSFRRPPIPTRAALRSPIRPYPPNGALYVIPEQMPSLRQLRTMSGCHFAPRCPLVTADCRRATPPNVAMGPDRTVACIRAEETRRIATLPAASASAAPARRPLLQVEDLERRYAASRGLFRNANEVAALKDASFSIAENE